MWSFLKYTLKRLFSVFLTLLVTTLILYGIMMFSPAEMRAMLYWPENTNRMSDEQAEKFLQKIIEEHHLNDPFPVQYFYWAKDLLKGEWGYSPTIGEDVFTAVMVRAPVTAELTIYSLLAFIPLGILSGVMAGTRRNKLADHSFRLAAYIATSLPPVILALVLLSIFYANLGWLAPERISIPNYVYIFSDQFKSITGLLTIDGFLNGRPDISLDALRHMVMPIFTLSLVHWATLGRITRTAMIETRHMDYVVAARARGIKEKHITWRHMLPNALAPVLTSSALSAASILTGVFVVEIIFGFHGISEIAVKSFTSFVPDSQTALGFTIYSVIVVLIMMTVLDVIQAAIDPRKSRGEGVN